MRATPTNPAKPEGPSAAIPSCALDDAGRRQQAARYQQLAATASRIEHKREAIVVQFDERLDRDLLEHALAVERECCPFFIFQLDESDKRLTMGVRQPDQLPALESIAAAFTSGQQASAEFESSA